jgi:hypothetical protein
LNFILAWVDYPKAAEGQDISKLNALKRRSYIVEARAELKTIKNYLRETVVF